MLQPMRSQRIKHSTMTEQQLTYNSVFTSGTCAILYLGKILRTRGKEHRTYLCNFFTTSCESNYSKTKCKKKLNMNEQSWCKI